MRLLTTVLLALTLPVTLSSPIRPPPPYPLVIWHGLGDTYTNPHLQSLSDLYTTLYPHAETYIITLSSNPSTDRTSTFLGHLPTQLSQVCSTLLSLPAPFTTTRLNLLGLSQGGQFLRALIQTCPLPSPPANLITFGSQHMGISQFLAECAPLDWTCKTTTALLNQNKWSSWAQHNLVPAQYFRDSSDLEAYLSHSEFLADVNNEGVEKNETYAEKLAQLDRFVMYIFEEDKTVFPKESGWFDDIDAETGKPVKLRDTKIYQEDWLGLKKLDEKGGLIFKTTPGEHMRLSDEVVKEAFEKYFRPVRAGEDKGKPSGEEEL